jgi:hypothetical protein
VLYGVCVTPLSYPHPRESVVVNVSHVYLTAHGEYHGSSPWVGEFAQMGVRVAYKPAADMPPRGVVFDLGPNGVVAAASGSQAGTNGTLTKSFTFRIGDTGSLENCDADEQISLAEDFRTFLVACAPYQAASFRWTHVKIAACDTDGKYRAPAAIYLFTTPIVGTASGTYGTTMPPETSLAMSLRAPIVGRRGRGRMFLPGLATSSAATDGLVASATQTALSNALKTFVLNLDDRPGTPTMDAVTIITSVGLSTAVRPSQARVGNHFDVQRSRQHQVSEGYTTQTI